MNPQDHVTIGSQFGPILLRWHEAMKPLQIATLVDAQTRVYYCVPSSGAQQEAWNQSCLIAGVGISVHPNLLLGKPSCLQEGQVLQTFGHALGFQKIGHEPGGRGL